MKKNLFSSLLLVGFTYAAIAAGVETADHNSLEDIVKMRDPFHVVEGIFKTKDELPKSDLEKYTVEEFKMVGVITGPDRLRAMVTGPDGKTHFVSKNDRIGTRQGRIHRITSQYIEVKEKLLNILGKEEDIFTKIILPNAGKIQFSSSNIGNPNNAGSGNVPAQEGSNE